MTFLLVMALVNIAFFLPLYAMNFRKQPNPFSFLRDTGYVSWATVRLLYARKRYSDPFRINFDFTFLVLLVGYVSNPPIWIVIVTSLVMTFGFLATTYASLMHVVFGRAPSLSSDLVLLKTGWSVAHRARYVFLLLGLALLAGVLVASFFVAQYLFEIFPRTSALPALLAVCLLPPCLYHWQKFLYSEFFWRVTYSPTLHLLRNLEFGRRTRGLLQQSSAYFDSLNEFKALTFQRPANIVILCIESYGSLIFKDPGMRAALSSFTSDFEKKLADNGYQIASNFSEAPIFAGGSWLSYTSFAYGALFDDAYIHDGLFGAMSNFASYESMFHVFERNGYSNVLLCPLGGVASRYVNWDALDRCFRPARKIQFEDLNYSGSEHSFFVPNDLYAAPDQYALNFAYESIRKETDAPISLFFCTLNSHYPWSTKTTIVDDWRTLNKVSEVSPRTRHPTDIKTAYVHAIEYQLRNLLDFVIGHADDDLLVIAFGDHQPPFITPEQMGKHTPVHIISKRRELIDVFLKHGFAPALDVADRQVEPIKHQGMLSLLMKAIAVACGDEPNPSIQYRPDGVQLRNAP